MKERPIIFSADSVKAIIDGRKTQTRRVVKPMLQDGASLAVVLSNGLAKFDYGNGLYVDDRLCPYGARYNTLWVRETWQRCPTCGNLDYRAGVNLGDSCRSCNEGLGKWKSPLFMFRENSRITLEITDVRVERLQDINFRDLQAEAVGMQGELTKAMEEYMQIWDSLNAKRGYPWSSNPWCWVIEFQKVTPCE